MISFLRNNRDLIEILARPFTIYLTTIATSLALFIPSVSVDKLWVGAALAGGMGIARSIDKKTAAVAASKENTR